MFVYVFRIKRGANYGSARSLIPIWIIEFHDIPLRGLCVLEYLFGKLTKILIFIDGELWS